MTIGVLSRSLGLQCGISEYAICLAARLDGFAFSSVYGMPGNLSPVFVQYEPSLYLGLPDLIEEIAQIEGIPVIDIHTEIPSDIVSALISINSAIVGVKHDPRPNTWYLPHISYAPVGKATSPPRRIRLGSFGFALPNKKYERMIELAVRLDVPLIILCAIADATPGIESLSKDYIGFLKSLAPPNVKIVSDFLPHTDIVKNLRLCSHLICAMDDLGRTSGSLRMMALAGRPIVSLSCPGADEVGAIQVQSLQDITIPFLGSVDSLPSFPDGLEQYIKLLDHLEKVHV